MKRYIVSIMLSLFFCVIQAQQPSLPVIEQYLQETGSVVFPELADTVFYNMLAGLSNKDKNLVLNFPEISDKGTKELIPFGYKINAGSELKIVKEVGNLEYSDNLLLYNRSMFSSVKYSLCDSIVWGLTLYGGKNLNRRVLIEQLKTYFSQPDYNCDTLTIFSDSDYLLKVGTDNVEAVSLYHCPDSIISFPGVRLYIPSVGLPLYCNDFQLDLNFYIQETKENNLQIAFQCFCCDSDGQHVPIENLSFISDQAIFDYTVDFERRVFVFPESMKRMIEHGAPEIVVRLKTGKVLYAVIPYYQYYSLLKAYRYFKWNVTNYKLKYNKW